MTDMKEPKVILGQYRGLAAPKPLVTVDDAEVESHVKRLLASKSSTCLILDRPVADGDTVVIDFEGFKDGIAFAGGKGSDYALKIGSHSFIDTFEEQLIGAEVGDRVEVRVTFPQQYGAAELAGQPAVFQVDVKGIQESIMPELTDKFVQVEFECENVAEFRQNIYNQIKEGKEITFTDQRRQILLNKALANASIELPEQLLKEAMNQTLEGIEMNMKQQGLTLEQYCQMTGTTMESVLEQIRPQAEMECKTRLLLEAIAREEQFTVTEEEEDIQMKQFSMMYNIPLDQVREMLSEEAMEMVRGDICVNKAVMLIMQTAVEE